MQVFETSAEWPHLAAIERERRQRAAMAFEQSLRGRRSITLSRQSSRGSRQRLLVQPSSQQQQPRRLHASSDEVLLVDLSAQQRQGQDQDKQRRVLHRSDLSRHSAPTVRDLPADGKLSCPKRYKKTSRKSVER